MEQKRIQKALNSLKINRMSLEDILLRWNEPHRCYHNQTHLDDLLTKIESLSVKEDDRDVLIVAALFHDIVYDPSSKENEELSDKLFHKNSDDKTYKHKDVITIILETKDHKPTTILSKLFSDLDMSVMTESYENLLKWEEGIFGEYSPVFGKELYKIGRISFLDSSIKDYPENADNLLKLKQFVESNY